MNNKALLKERNRTIILKVLQKKPGITRQELAEITRLSFPTVSKIVQVMTDERILRENGKNQSSGGRCSDKLEINPQAGNLISLSIDVRHLHIMFTDFCYNIKATEFIEINLAAMNEIEMHSFIADALLRFIHKNNIDFKSVKCAGIGVSGYADEKGFLYSSFFKVGKFDFAGFFPGKIPVFVQNNSNLETIREHEIGKAQGKTHIACILITGSGIGAGIILDGRLYTGFHGSAGEFGIMRYLWDDLRTAVQPDFKVLIKLGVRTASLITMFLDLQHIYICGNIEDKKEIVQKEIEKNSIFGKRPLITLSHSGFEGASLGAAIYARKKFLNETEFSDDYSLLNSRFSQDGILNDKSLISGGEKRCADFMQIKNNNAGKGGICVK